MRRAMHKPCDIHFKRFAPQLIEINFLPHLPGSYLTNKIPIKELNGIFIHAVPKRREIQSYLQGWDFEMRT